jgi:hypothetical protein
MSATREIIPLPGCARGNIERFLLPGVAQLSD